MSRKEFSAATVKARLEHCGMQCEHEIAGVRCKTIVRRGHFHADHDTPDQMGGKPVFANLRILCIPCHKQKTVLDLGDIARAKRQEAAELGTAPLKKTGLEGRSQDERKVAKAPKRPSLPFRPMFVDAAPSSNARRPR